MSRDPCLAANYSAKRSKASDRAKAPLSVPTTSKRCQEKTQYAISSALTSISCLPGPIRCTGTDNFAPANIRDKKTERIDEGLFWIGHLLRVYRHDSPIAVSTLKLAVQVVNRFAPDNLIAF